MIKVDFKRISKRDVTKMVAGAAEKQISEVARRVAAPHGGGGIRVKAKAGGSRAAGDLEGSEQAVKAARDALGD
jgi:hypothetical protein